MPEKLDWQIWTRSDVPPSAWSAVGRESSSPVSDPAVAMLVWRSARDGKIHRFMPVGLATSASRASGWNAVCYTFQAEQISDVIRICDAYVAGQRAAQTEIWVMERPCAVHAGEVHGGEATELRTRIESLIQQYRNDWDLGEAAQALQEVLDEVDARDSLAYAERADALRRGSLQP